MKITILWGHLIIAVLLAQFVDLHAQTSRRALPPINCSSELILPKAKLLPMPDIHQHTSFIVDSNHYLLSNGMIDPSRVPAAHLYNNMWDNQVVNPYGIPYEALPDTSEIDFSGYVHPFCNYTTSFFGMRRGRYHYGTDIKLFTGDSVRASFDGLVRIARVGKGYGYYVVIRHPNGLETVYAHLSKFLVTPNQPVKAGQVIALGGNTGRSYGSHLHFEVRYLGHPIDPRPYVDFERYEAKTDNLIQLAKSDDFKYLQSRPHRTYYVASAYQSVVKNTPKGEGVPNIYTVKKGDTLSGIAVKTGTTVTYLCQVNNISRTSILQIGQKIRYYL